MRIGCLYVHQCVYCMCCVCVCVCVYVHSGIVYTLSASFRASHISVCLCVCVSVYLSVCLSICVSVFLFVSPSFLPLHPSPSLPLRVESLFITSVLLADFPLHPFMVLLVSLPSSLPFFLLSFVSSFLRFFVSSFLPIQSPCPSFFVVSSLFSCYPHGRDRYHCAGGEQTHVSDGEREYHPLTEKHRELCMRVCVCGRTCMSSCMCVFMYVCMYVCVYVCMYVCMCVWGGCNFLSVNVFYLSLSLLTSCLSLSLLPLWQIFGLLRRLHQYDVCFRHRHHPLTRSGRRGGRGQTRLRIIICVRERSERAGGGRGRGEEGRGGGGIGGGGGGRGGGKGGE